jgi:hypothetical protein
MAINVFQFADTFLGKKALWDETVREYPSFGIG